MLNTLLNWLLPKRALMSGRMYSTSTEQDTGENRKLHYSAYSEFEYMHEDNRLFIRFICTFGLERIPENNELKNASRKTLRQWGQDGLIPWVCEIYFLNYGNNNIIIKPLTLTVMNNCTEFDETFDFPPSDLKITPPLIMLHSSFGTEFDVELSFEYMGEVIKIERVAKRLTVEEVNIKYSS